MRKLKLLMVAFMAMCGMGVNAADKVVGERFATIDELNGKLFAVVDEPNAKAMGIGVAGHAGSHDMYFGTYEEVWAASACFYKIEPAQGEGVDGYYYLRAYSSAGVLFEKWGTKGYFNSQTGTGGYFALGLNGQNGQDALNHAVWEITVSEGKFAVKNIGTGKYLHADELSNTYADPFYFTFCTLIDDPLPAAQEQYNALKTKYLAINSTLDVTDAEALFTNATTVDEVQAAIDKLVATFGDYLANVGGETNLTTLITNPSFESNFTGWINNGMATQDNSSFAGKVGSIYCEAWQPNGTKSVSQTLTLPQGLYRMSANALARGVTSAKIYAGSKEKAITIVDASNTYKNEFYVNGGGDVTIGFEGVGTGAGASWLCVDNFQLAYVQNMTAEEYVAYEAFVEVKEEYDLLYAEATAFDENTLPSKAKQAFLYALSQISESYNTTAEYNAVLPKLKQGLDLAKSVVVPYAVYLDTKANVEAMKDADTYTGADAKSTLEGVITTTASNVENAEDATTINTQTTNLVAAAKTFVKSVTIKADQCLDLTCLIKNPHFKYGEGGSGKVAADWTLESGWVTEHRLQTHNFEAWHAHFNLSQTIEDLPKGTYKVTLQGFARHDNASVTDKTNLYCGLVNQQIKDINAEYSTTSFYSSAQPAMGDNNRDSQATLGGNTVYRPNGMTGAYYWFSEVNPETGQPFYTNEVQTLIPTPGNLKIGFKCEADADWVIWDNFHLYYYGSAIAVDLDEAVGTSYTEDIENANVTLKKTILAGLNTIVLPFEADPSEFNGTALYEFDGYEGTTLKFKTATTIEANVPYLLDASADATGPFTFNGVTVKAATDLTSGTDAYQFVGTYQQIQVADGDYILGDDGTNGVGFYRSAGGNKVKAYRAYIKKAAPAGDAARLVISIDGVTTAIDAIDGQPINNAVIYNLAGQKVKNAQKGLYIQNGKKVVIK